MSRCTIAVSKVLAEYLEERRATQASLLTRLGIEQDNLTPIVHAIGVVENDDGKHAVVARVDGHNYSRWFRDFCVDNNFGTYEKVAKTFMKNGKPHIRGTHYSGLVPHALRHTQATLLIGGGSDVKTVQTRLGHASPSTTLAIYVRAIEANDRRASEAWMRREQCWTRTATGRHGIARVESSDSTRDARPGSQVPLFVPDGAGGLRVATLSLGFPLDGKPNAVFNTRIKSALEQLRRGRRGMWARAIVEGRCLVPARAFYESHATERITSKRTGKPVRRQ